MSTRPNKWLGQKEKPQRTGLKVIREARAGMHSLNEGQKVSFEVTADRKTGKSSAHNLRAA